MTHRIYAGDVAQQTSAAGPKYRYIADDLRRRIERGEFAPGSRLPTKVELMAQHHVAVNTVERAIAELRNDGLIETTQGAGMFVTDAAGRAPTAPIDERVAALERRLDLLDKLAHRVEVLETLVMDLRANAGLEQTDEDEESRVAAQ